MSGKDKKNRKLEKEIITEWIPGVILGIFANEILLLFLIVLTILRIIIQGSKMFWIISKRIGRYVKKKEKLKREAEWDEQKKSNYGYEKDEITDALTDDIKEDVQKFGGKVCRLIVVAAFICVLNAPTVKTLAHDTVTFVKAGQKEVREEKKKKDTEKENTTKEETNRPAESTSVKNTSEENTSKKNVSEENMSANESSVKSVNNTVTTKNRKKKPQNYRFVLKEAKTDLEKDKEIKKVLKINDLKQWLNENQKENYSGYNKIPNEFGRTFSEYALMESEFGEEIEKNKNIEYLDEWKMKAPVSTTLDEIIEGKRAVARTLQKNELDNYFVWWSLANDCQNYAIEYMNQTDKGEKITFYYLKSIYYCLQALEFQNDEEVSEMIRNYVKERYRELLTINGIEEEYRKFALEALELWT